MKLFKKIKKIVSPDKNIENIKFKFKQTDSEFKITFNFIVTQTQFNNLFTSFIGKIPGVNSFKQIEKNKFQADEKVFKVGANKLMKLLNVNEIEEKVKKGKNNPNLKFLNKKIQKIEYTKNKDTDYDVVIVVSGLVLE